MPPPQRPAGPPPPFLPPGARFRAAVRTAWFLFGQFHPTPGRMLFLGVLPLSLLPPLMVFFAGSRHGDQFLPGFADRDWPAIALILWQAEWLTIPLMIGIVRTLAHLNGVRTGWRQAALLAFVAPVPLWLSSLILLYPSLTLALAVGGVALLLSGVIIYHGVAIILGVREDVNAAYLAYGIMAAGLIAWALLLAVVIPLR